MRTIDLCPVRPFLPLVTGAAAPCFPCLHMCRTLTARADSWRPPPAKSNRAGRGATGCEAPPAPAALHCSAVKSVPQRRGEMPNPRSGPWCCEGQAGIPQRGAAAGREAAVPSRNLQRAERAFSSMLICMCVCVRICTYRCVSRDGVKFHQEQEKSVSKSSCASRQGEQEPALLKPRFSLLSARTRPNGHPFARRGDAAVLRSLWLQRSCRKLARGAHGIPTASLRHSHGARPCRGGDAGTRASPVTGVRLSPAIASAGARRRRAAWAGGQEPGRWGWRRGRASREVGCVRSGGSCVFWRGPRWASVPGCRARRAVPSRGGLPWEPNLVTGR